MDSENEHRMTVSCCSEWQKLQMDVGKGHRVMCTMIRAQCCVGNYCFPPQTRFHKTTNSNLGLRTTVIILGA